MPNIDINGTVVAFPDDLDQATLTDAVKKAASSMGGQATPQSNFEKMKQMASQGNYGKAAWAGLGVPEEMSRSGLNQMMDLQNKAQNFAAEKTGLPIGTEPTGNLPRDIAANVPRIAGESIAEVAPSFIDRNAILIGMGGMAMKAGGMAAGKILPKLAPTLEAGSGLQKGTLVEAFKDPGMIADFGSKLKASALYNEIKEGASVPKHLRTNAKVVSDAMNNMSQGKMLSAPDAFEARKAVNALMKSKNYPIDDLLKTKEGLEAMVLGSVKEADKLYRRAILGEQMRNYARLNQSGKPGPISGAIISKIPFMAPLISPVVHGAGVSAAGAASKASPRAIANTSAGAAALLNALKANKKKE